MQVYNGKVSESLSNGNASSSESSPTSRETGINQQSANGHSNGNAAPTAIGHANSSHDPMENGVASPSLLGHQPQWVLNRMADLLLTHFDFEAAPLARAALFEVRRPKDSHFALLVFPINLQLFINSLLHASAPAIIKLQVCHVAADACS